MVTYRGGKKVSEALQRAQKRNWLIYRVRGTTANLYTLQSALGDESRISPATFTRLRKAIAELNNASQDIIKELSNGD